MNKNLFGTDGIRGTVGIYPMTIDQLPDLGNAIAQWICKTESDSPIILLGHDTRLSCSLVKSALLSKLLLYPITIHDAYVLPTPAVYLLTKLDKKFHGGIIISASHNPFYDNGIKLVNAATGKLRAEDEQLIMSFFNTQATTAIAYDRLGTVQPFLNATELYIDYLAQWFSDHSFLRGKKIVLDCANGATSGIAPRLFAQLGAQVIALHHQPNGRNINEACGALHTEDAQKAVLENNADAGFAFDGDGDRIIAINRHGKINDGDDILALLTSHPAYAAANTLVGTIVSNYGFERWLAAHGKTLIRTAVGDKHIAQQLSHDNLMLGGEQSGHIVLRDYLEIGDGIFTALRILQTLHHTNNWDMVTFDKYPQILINLPVAVKKDLESEPLASIIEESKAQLHAGRIIVRYSGTENLLRVMVEDDSHDHAQHIANVLARSLHKTLSIP